MKLINLLGYARGNFPPSQEPFKSIRQGREGEWTFGRIGSSGEAYRLGKAYSGREGGNRTHSLTVIGRLLANLSAASPFAGNYPPLALSGCFLFLGDPSELLGILLELGTVDLEGLLLGQVSAALEEGSNEAHPASVGLVEALVVVVSGVLSGLLVDGLTIMEDNQGPLDPSLVGGELLTDGGDKVLELDRLSALGAAHVLTVAFRELEDNQPSNPRKGVIRDIRTACRKCSDSL